MSNSGFKCTLSRSAVKYRLDGCKCMGKLISFVQNYTLVLRDNIVPVTCYVFCLGVRDTLKYYRISQIRFALSLINKCIFSENEFH